MNSNDELGKLYSTMGFALNRWQLIESILSVIFFRLIFAQNINATSAAFYAAVNFMVKLSMVDAAAHFALSPQRLKRWARLHKEAARLAGKRNDLVHFQHDSDDSLPEGKRHTLTPNMFDDGSRKRFRGNNRPSYNLADVQKIHVDFEVLQVELRKFSMSLRTLKPKRPESSPVLKPRQMKASDKKASPTPRARPKPPQSSQV